MVKKRPRKSVRRTRKRSSRSTGLHPAVMKMVGALAVLVLLVCSAGLLARHFLKNPPLQEMPPAVQLPMPPPKAPTAVVPKADEPRYEVFPDRTLPPKPLDKLPQLPGDHPPLVAIVIDDIGYDLEVTSRLLSLDAPLTFSILPYGPRSQSLAAEAKTKGHEIMLHLPMEPKEFPDINPGPGALLSQMTPDELIGQLNDNLDRITGLKGVNNHMGSGLSTSPEQMRQIFAVLKKRGLYYIDSRTTADTVARSSAQLLNLPFAERDVFIDHLENDKFIRGQLRLLIKRARHQGYALGIAHPHPITYDILSEMLPELKQAVALVPASMVVEAEMAAHKAATQAAR
jgi:polysaccharide deacetylase 2 family uncharacterized protein YibQ